MGERAGVRHGVIVICNSNSNIIKHYVIVIVIIILHCHVIDPMSGWSNITQLTADMTFMNDYQS